MDPNAPGISKRRNGLDIAPTSFQKIVKDLGQHPFKLRITPGGDPDDRAWRDMRLAFCNRIVGEPDDFFRRLIVTDETTLR